MAENKPNKLKHETKFKNLDNDVLQYFYILS